MWPIISLLNLLQELWCDPKIPAGMRAYPKLYGLRGPRWTAGAWHLPRWREWRMQQVMPWVWRWIHEPVGRRRWRDQRPSSSGSDIWRSGCPRSSAVGPATGNSFGPRWLPGLRIHDILMGIRIRILPVQFLNYRYLLPTLLKIFLLMSKQFFQRRGDIIPCGVPVP